LATHRTAIARINKVQEVKYAIPTEDRNEKQRKKVEQKAVRKGLFN
jgi:hypothetical protein